MDKYGQSVHVDIWEGIGNEVVEGKRRRIRRVTRKR